MDDFDHDQIQSDLDMQLLTQMQIEQDLRNRGGIPSFAPQKKGMDEARKFLLTIAVLVGLFFLLLYIIDLLK